MIKSSMEDNDNLNLALTHDFLNQFGGAERALYFFTRIFPEAPIYTSMYFQDYTYDSFKKRKIHVSFMQKIPGINKDFKKYLMFYPFAFRNFNLSEYDIIIASSSAFSSFIKKSQNTILICYCYTPPRFLWDTERYLEGEKTSTVANILLKPVLKYLRRSDIKNSNNIDHYIAISRNVAERIKRIYNRDSIVIYPPIDIDNYLYREKKEDFYLMVSRLKGYKRIDIAIKAFNSTGQKLLIIGRGEDERNLKDIAEKNIEFLGRVPEERLLELYSKAKALVFTGEEDFGLVPLEAQASGTPVLAYGRGGSVETIIEGKTGYFFNTQDANALIDVLEKFEACPLDADECRRNAMKFDFKVFEREIIDFISGVKIK